MNDPYVLIVGAGPGLGMALARKFGGEFGRAVLFARSQQNLAALAERLRGERIETHTRAVDSGDISALETALNASIQEMGPPAVVIYHGAAVVQRRPLALPPAAFARELTVNVVGAHLTTLVAAAAMREGTILYTGGGFAMSPNADYASLSAAKAAMRSLAESAAPDLAARGLHLAVINICGFVEPEGRFSGDRIAEAYWAVHCQGKAQWTFELNYS